jgi:ribonucleoside-diphosphate reductase alpha chain
MIDPVLTDISQRILATRYLIRNERQEIIETPKALFQRVAKFIASAETTPHDKDKWEAIFYRLMASCEFEPNTPCLVNAGRPDGTGQLSACFVIPVADSMDGIFSAMRNMALVQKTGGGTGFSFSRLRPEGDFVASTSGIASGPCSFMEVFDFATERIKQGGVRRGANMGILRIDHPDILKFIKLKMDRAKMQNFNVSVAITDAFMFALESNKDYDLLHPVNGHVVGQMNARDVWNEIVRCAHFIGDPGLWFIDRTNAADPLSEVLGPIEATNPCGEVPLRPYDACCLGSINLSNFYVEKEGTSAHKYGNVMMRHGSIDFDRLQRTVQHSVRFLDNMLSVNKYPIPEIADVTSKCRKIGLGVMGWADLLIQLGLPYGSPEARELGSHVMKLVNTWAVDASEKLAEERQPFHHWPASTWAKRGDKPRRHATVTVIAPTGTISMIAGCSSGVEPEFALSMTREQAGLTMLEVNPLVEKIAKREGFWSDELAETVRKTGSLKDAPGIPDHWRAVFAIANELDAEAHIGMQASFQQYTEDAVSKTINLHRTATTADVENAYLLAWQKGCKGITVYRDGCREGQVLTAGAAPEAKPMLTLDQANDVLQTAVAAVERRTGTMIVPAVKRRVPNDGRREGVTLSKSTPYGTVHMTVNNHPDDGDPFELFVRVGKSGSEVMAWAEAFGRVVSYTLALPSPFSPKVRLEEVARQLHNIGGGDVWNVGMERVVSAPDAISKLLLAHLGVDDGYDKSAVTVEAAMPMPPMPEIGMGYMSSTSTSTRAKSRSLSDLCPSCGKATFTYQQRCGLCTSCGHSKC